MTALLRTVALLVLVCVGLPSCIDTSTMLESERLEGVDPALLAAQARRAYAHRGSSQAQVELAFDLMRKAARASSADDPARFDRLAAAASFAIWLARHGSFASDHSAHAEAALVLCNTAVGDAPGRVEGYYYRAVATGLFARENALYGPDAMGQIRSDARRAIDLDPGFEEAGPHRVLGGLYLQAPGPPAGVGSLRRAVRELEAAVRIAPDHPGNLLFLLAAYLESNRQGEEMSILLERVPSAIAGSDDAADRALWRREMRDLRARIAAR